MPSDDMVRQQHMLEAAQEAIGFAAGRSLTDLHHDRMFALALVRLVEIVGEAAARVSEGCKSRLPEVPWQDIIGMRNRLVHAYFDVNMDIIWLTVVKFMPDLVRSIKKYLDEVP
jgi:uncharacterized protein with HEPN domain